MLLKIRQLFSLDKLTNKEDKRLARVLLAIIVIYLGGSLAVMVMDIFLGDHSLTPFLLLGMVLQTISLALLRQGKLAASSYVAVGIYIGFATIFATIGQGLRDYVIMTYPAIILLAGLTNKRRGLVVSTLLTMAALVWLVLGEMNGWFTIQKVFSPTIFDLVIAILLVLITSSGMYMLLENLEEGHTQTRKELTERLRVEEALISAHQLTQSTLDALAPHICVLDANGVILSVNRTWREFADANPPHPDDYWLGESYIEVCKRAAGQGSQEAEVFAGGILSVIRGEREQFDMEYPCDTPAEKHWFNGRVRRFLVDGQLRVVITHEDITEKKKAEQNLSQSREMYRLLAENITDVIWIFDVISGRTTYISPSVERLRGFTAEEVLKQDISEIVTPASLEYVQRNIPLRVKAFQEGYRGSYVDELEQKCKDGSVIWTEVTTNFQVNQSNNHLEMYGVSRNISERKKIEYALIQSEQRFRILGENLEEAALYIYSHDTEGNPHFEYLSKGMETLTGVKAEDAMKDAAKIHSTILPEYLSKLAELETNSKRDLSSFELEIRQKHAATEEIRWALLRSTPRRRNDGSTVWYGVQLDITQIKQNEKLLEHANEQLVFQLSEIEQLQAELQEQAIRDPLTGLHNRRYMQDFFMREFSRAIRENYSVSVIMIDMDELKVFNDTYGHHIGDLAIQIIAQKLQSMIRTEDFVCRYGGDEFTVILSKTNIKSALKRVEEWRESLNNHPIPVNHNGDTVTIKFTAGIASFPQHGTSMEEIINFADVALYRAKAHGRNCTIVFS